MDNTITFGFEVECLIPEGEALSVGRHGHGTLVPWLAGWAVERDNSIKAKELNGYEAMEFVSPAYPLEALPAALSAIREIKNHGAVVNSTCGGHIHIGLKHWLGTTPTQSKILYFLLKCIEGMARIEDGIFAYSGGEARRKSTFCTQMKEVRVGELSLNSLENGGRYTTLNSNSFWRHGTIEFRLFDGGVDPEQWEKNLKIALRLIEACDKEEALPLLGMNITSLKWLEKWAGVEGLKLHDIPLWYVVDGKIVVANAPPFQSARGFKTNRAAWYYREYLKRKEVFSKHRPFNPSGWDRYLAKERRFFALIEADPNHGVDAYGAEKNPVPTIILPDLNTCWDDVVIPF